MQRRLYFLLPDNDHAQALVSDLTESGVDRDHLHAIPGGRLQTPDLPPTTEPQRRDAGRTLEQWLWDGNLVLFFLALAGLLYSLWALSPVGSVVAAAVMVASFVAGLLFTTVPNTHLEEFRPALNHGEILLMVDVPKGRVAELEERVHRRHPEATVGGVGWSVDAFGL